MHISVMYLKYENKMKRIWNNLHSLKFILSGTISFTHPMNHMMKAHVEKIVRQRQRQRK